MSGNSRSKYLFVDDYGMGGIWVYVYAKNPADVEKKYPALKFVRDKPKWLLNHETEHSLCEYDIEEDSPDLETYRKDGS